MAQCFPAGQNMVNYTTQRWWMYEIIKTLTWIRWFVVKTFNRSPVGMDRPGSLDDPNTLLQSHSCTPGVSPTRRPRSEAYWHTLTWTRSSRSVSLLRHMGSRMWCWTVGCPHRPKERGPVCPISGTLYCSSLWCDLVSLHWLPRLKVAVCGAAQSKYLQFCLYFVKVHL